MKITRLILEVVTLALVLGSSWCCSGIYPPMAVPQTHKREVGYSCLERFKISNSTQGLQIFRFLKLVFQLLCPGCQDRPRYTKGVVVLEGHVSWTFPVYTCTENSTDRFHLFAVCRPFSDLSDSSTRKIWSCRACRPIDRIEHYLSSRRRPQVCPWGRLQTEW